MSEAAHFEAITARVAAKANERAEAVVVANLYFCIAAEQASEAIDRGGEDGPMGEVAFIRAVLRLNWDAPIDPVAWAIFRMAFVPRAGDAPRILKAKAAGRDAAAKQLEDGVSPDSILARQLARLKIQTNPEADAL